MKALYLFLISGFLVLAQAETLTAQAFDYWQNVTGDIQQLAVDPNNPDHIFFAAADGYIGSSRDGGQTWQASRLGQNTPNDRITSLVALGNDSLLVSVFRDGDNRFYSSTDGGQTWTIILPQQNQNQSAELRALAPGMIQVSDQIVSRDGLQTTDSLEVPGLLAGDGQGGIFRFVPVSSFGLVNGMSTYTSDDLGRTWNTVAEGIAFGVQFASNDVPIRVNSRSNERFAMLFGQDDRIAVSIDGGASFTLGNADLNGVLDVVWLDDNTLVAYDDYRGAAMSTDAGATWMDAPQYTNTNQTLTSQTRAIADGNGGVLLARRADLYRIPAGGGSAAILRRAMHSDDVSAVKCIDNLTARYNNSQGVNRTYDGGLTWQVVEGADLDYRLLMGTAEGWWAQGPGRDLYLSSDRGAKWTLKADLPTSGFNQFLTMFAAGETGLVVVLGTGSVVSYDRGETWEARPSVGNTSSNGIDDAGAATTGSWMQQFGQGNTYDMRITRDSASTFVAAGITDNQQRGAGAAAVEGRYYATPHYVSDDLGLSWVDLNSRQGFEDRPWRGVWFRNARHGAFHDADGRSSTTTYDGGQTWQAGNSMVPRHIHFRDTSTAMAFDNSKGLFRFEQPIAWPVEVLPGGGVSSVSAFAKTPKLEVYPNPVLRGGTLRVEGCTAGEEVRLVDMAGRVVLATRVHDDTVQIPSNLHVGLFSLVTEEGIVRVMVR